MDTQTSLSRGRRDSKSLCAINALRVVLFATRSIFSAVGSLVGH